MYAIRSYYGLDYEGFFEVKTLLDGEKVDVQTVETAEKLLANEFVEFLGSGALTETAGTALEGGANGSGGAGEYSDALAAFEAEDFNVLGIPVDDSAVKQLAVAFTKRLREQEGKSYNFV